MHARFVICVDDRFPGGTSSALIDELTVLSRDFTSDDFVLLNVRSTVFAADAPPNPRLASLLDTLDFPIFDLIEGRLSKRGSADGGDEAAAIPSLDADFLIVHNPLVAFGLPDAETAAGLLSARLAIVVAHQPYIDSNGVPYYALGDVIRRVGAVASRTMFAPIGPLSRQNMLTGVLARSHLTPFDWPNIFSDASANPQQPRRFEGQGLLSIGRHSRSDWVKWPATRAEFEMVYQFGKPREAAFLGWGAYCDKVFPEGPPANWRTHRFGEITPDEFLASIDLFVYYHHSNWVEGFGRTVAEAIFSGAPCLLQPSLEETFSGLAFYPAPEDVERTLAHFDSRRDRLSEWSNFARQVAAACFGPSQIRAVYSTLMQCDFSSGDPSKQINEAAASLRNAQSLLRQQIGAAKTIQADLGLVPERASAKHPLALVADAPPAPEQPDAIATPVVDIAIYTDMRSARSDAWRSIELAESFHALGRSVAIVHVAGTGKADLSAPSSLFRQVSPGIRLLGLDPESDSRFLSVRTGCIVTAAHLQIGDAGTPLFEHAVRAATPAVLCIVDRKQPAAWYGPADNALTLLFGVRPRWAVLSLTDDVAKALPQAFNVPELRCFVAPRPLSGLRDVRRLHNEGGPVRRGRIGLMDASQWRQEDGASAESVPFGPLFLFATPHAKLAPADIVEREDVFEFRSEDISLARFLDKVDIVTYFPGDKPSDLQLIPLLRAAQAGVLVIADGRFKPVLKGSALYAQPSQLQSTLERYARDPSHLLQTAITKARSLAVVSRPETIVARLEGLLAGDAPDAQPKAVTQKPAPPRTPRQVKREVLFLSSNGVGLGHLTRLMAIARRLDQHQPVFVTMSQAFGIVREAGWPVKYLPFHEVSGCNVADWNSWLAHEISDIIRHRKGIDCLVFDGSNPYSGLLSAALPAHVQKVWIQRGMWKLGHLQAEHIRRGRHFDMIIEPSDIAESTAEIDVQSEAFDKVKVDPIWLLEKDELLSREEAKRELGLPSDQPCCLVQLGSGTNRDIISMLDTIVRALRAKKVKICIAEWLMGSEVPRIWPDVTYLRVFPLSRYFRGFDFAISAAGYNSFHEVIGFELPAIFIANEHQTMDDQQARAKFAMENDASIWVAESDVPKIDAILDIVLQPDVREMMTEACRELKPKNGAIRAARIIEDLSSGGTGRLAH